MKTLAVHPAGVFSCPKQGAEVSFAGDEGKL
jgi:hypothetical protein